VQRSAGLHLAATLKRSSKGVQVCPSPNLMRIDQAQPLRRLQFICTVWKSTLPVHQVITMSRHPSSYGVIWMRTNVRYIVLRCITDLFCSHLLMCFPSASYHPPVPSSADTENDIPQHHFSEHNPSTPEKILLFPMLDLH